MSHSKVDKSTSWFVTWNNPPKNGLAKWAELYKDSISYLVG